MLTSSVIVLFRREGSDLAVFSRPQLGSTGAEFQPSCFSSRVCARSMSEHKSIMTFFGEAESHLFCERGHSKPSEANRRPAILFNWLPLTHGHMLPRPWCPPALPIHMGMVGAPSAGGGQRGQTDRWPFSLPSPETSPSAPHSLCSLSPSSVPAVRSPRDVSCSALRKPWVEAEPWPWHSTVTPEA